MELWVRARQVMAAVDAVTRDWGRKLSLGERDVYVVMMLEVRGGLGCTALAAHMGRRRQHVQRSLLSLEARNIVEAGKHGTDGRVTEWKLSPLGERVAGVLRKLTGMWEAHVASSCDVELLSMTLERGRTALVNGWCDPRGWIGGLAMPDPIERPEPSGLEALVELDRLREEIRSQASTDAGKQRSVRRKALKQEAAAAAEEAADDAFARLWRD